MRPFYYPLLVILALAGLTIVAGNMRVRDQTHVCVRCGRVRETVAVFLFGSPFRDRVEQRETEFTRVWPGASACREIDHVFVQTDTFLYRSSVRGSRRVPMPDGLRHLLDDPAPALLLRQLDPQRADRLLQDLVAEAQQGGGYWAGGNRWVWRQPGASTPTEELIERLREKGMTPEELRQWDEERGTDDRRPR